jgi:hypothetical protein
MAAEGGSCKDLLVVAMYCCNAEEETPRTLNMKVGSPMEL